MGTANNDDLGKNAKNKEKPIDDISFFYSGEKIENQGKTYSVLDADKFINCFGDDKNAIWGKKTEPTLIRKAKTGEEIITYVDNGKGEKIEESRVTALEGQYVFQNLNNPDDTYIPQDSDIIKEYEVTNPEETIGNEFKEFIRKSKPCKILLEIIKIPTVVTIASRGDFTQFLEEGATLKLENNSRKPEIVGINKGGFDAWSLTDKDGNIIEKADNKISNNGKNKELIDVLETSNILNLAMDLGLNESQEMIDIRENLIKLILEKKDFVELYVQYENLAINVINQYKGENFTKGQLSLLLMKAYIFYKGGESEYSQENFDEATEYADQMDFKKIAAKIKQLRKEILK